MKTITLVSLLFMTLPTFANYENYDQIVEKLSKYQTEETRSKPIHQSELRNFSRAHLGIGITQTFYDADAQTLDSRLQNQGGMLINVGVDVLNSSWGIEGSYSNFGKNNTRDTEIRLREFSLKGLYKPLINKTWSMRLGLGFSSRFLEINNPSVSESYKTPSGLFVIGLDSYLNSFVSIGADFNFKTAMIDDTIDNNSADLTFRIDTHF